MDKKNAALLARSLERIEQSGQTVDEYLDEHPELNDEFAELLEVIEGLSNFPTPSPTSQFRYAARSRILTYLIDHQPVIFEGRIRRIWKTTIRKFAGISAMPVLIIATLLLSLLGGGTVYASQASLPGDLLYPVKVAVEDFRINMAPEASQGDLYLTLAGERVEEVTFLIAEGRYEDIPTAMQRFEGLVEGAAESSPTETESLEVHTEVLTELLDRVPEQAKDAIRLAIEVSSKHFGEEEDPSSDPSSAPPFEPPGPPEELPGPPFEPPGPPEELPGSQDEPTGPPFESPGPPEELPAPTGEPPSPPEELPGQPDEPAGPPVESPGPPEELPVPTVEPPDPPVQPPGRP